MAGALLTRNQFTRKFAAVAQKAAAGTGLFPETLLAISIVEGQGVGPNGNYFPANNTLAIEANNLFGIKNYPKWKGPTYNFKGSKWVKYPSQAASFQGFVNFVRDNKRYKDRGVFTAPNFQEQIIRLASANYCEDPETWKRLIFAVNDSIKGIVSSTAKAALDLAPWILTFALLYGSQIIKNNKNE